MKKTIMRISICCFVPLLFSCNSETKVEKIYFPNGSIRESIEMKAGQKNGLDREYFEDGKVSRESYYKNGLLDGRALCFRADGTLDWDVEYVQGKETGVYKEFYPDGKIKTISHLVNGVQNGKTFEYYPNGIKKNEVDYLNGKNDGIYRSFFENGKPSMFVVSENKMTIYKKVFNEMGKVTDENKVLYIESVTHDTLKEGEKYIAKILFYSDTTPQKHIIKKNYFLGIDKNSSIKRSVPETLSVNSYSATFTSPALKRGTYWLQIDGKIIGVDSTAFERKVIIVK
jgi:hypothetical protein